MTWTRYRISCYLDDNPKINKRTVCKNIRRDVAIMKAVELAQQLERHIAANGSSASWTVEIMRGAIDRWEIVASSYSLRAEIDDARRKPTG